MSVKLLVIVIICVKRYPSKYCLMQGRCVICSDLKFEEKKYLKIRITTFKDACVKFVLIVNCPLPYYRGAS
mgnify:CR=1 FL=1